MALFFSFLVFKLYIYVGQLIFSGGQLEIIVGKSHLYLAWACNTCVMLPPLSAMMFCLFKARSFGQVKAKVELNG